MIIKQRMRLTVDLAMTLLLPLLMAYSLVGETAHEWLGISMAVLFVSHQWLNFGWYKGLLRGRYNALRTMLTITDLLLIIVFLLLFYSGLDLSKHLLPLLPELGSASLSRTLHLSCSHWGLVLMSFHLGLHLSRFVALVKYKALRNVLTALACLVTLYGCYAFFSRAFLSYLLPTSAFLFFDAGQPIVRLLADLGALMVLFALLGYIAARLTQHNK